MSERELKILAAAEHKAKNEGDCWLHFKKREDGGVMVIEETDHIKELES